MSLILSVFSLLLGAIARLWMMTVRTQTLSHSSLRASADRPWVLALWHGHLLALLTHRRRRRTFALVSLSRDGEMLAPALRFFSVEAVRGSSSKGGRQGLATIVSKLGEGYDAAFAVDGPCGPARVAKPGALAAARDGGGQVVPYAAACSCAILLSSWDGFVIPLPFSRIMIVLGEPIASSDIGTDELAARIDSAARIAQKALTEILDKTAPKAFAWDQDRWNVEG